MFYVQYFVREASATPAVTECVSCRDIETARRHAVMSAAERGFSRVVVCTQDFAPVCSEAVESEARRVGLRAFGLKAGIVACTVAWIAAFSAVAFGDDPWINAALILAGIAFGFAACGLHNARCRREDCR